MVQPRGYRLTEETRAKLREAARNAKAAAYQQPIAVPATIDALDRQTSMRLTLDWMVRLNGGRPVSVPSVMPA